MLAHTRYVLFFCFSLPLISRADTTCSSCSETYPLPRNVFHIFNALHSSLRQWGSSLNHNGMSYFPASVPAGTELYHGRPTNDTVTGFEWLAFEPEHAQLFANHGPGERMPRPSGMENDPPKHGMGPPPFHAGHQKPLSLKEREDDPEAQLAGYLHTYTTKRDLHLLYIDGLSAAKTSNGTLDSQFHGVLNATETHRGMWDYQLAAAMCSIAANEWKGRVDGFIRMEAGFEMILCDFAEGVDLKRITRAGRMCVPFDSCRYTGTEAFEAAIFAYMRAISDRYDGIGGNRIRINRDRFVTAYTQDFDLFSGRRSPRLENAPPRILSAIRSELDALVLSDPNPFTTESIDWQSVIDMIVTRYSARLQYLSSLSMINDERSFLQELDLLLSSFIAYDSRSPSAEIARCTNHFLPETTTPTLASSTTTYVSNYICKILFQLLSSPQDRFETMKKLIADLNWTTWKQCRGCGWDEICFVPIWPRGSEEDWLKPGCVNATALNAKQGYWGMPGGGRPGEGPPGRGPPPGGRRPGEGPPGERLPPPMDHVKIW